MKKILVLGLAISLTSMTSCKKDDFKAMAPSGPSSPGLTVSSTEADMVGDWICDGDTIIDASSVSIFDSTYVNWHLELVNTAYADTSVGVGYMQLGWYHPADVPNTPYYWRVVDTGDPHYQLNAYLLNSYPYQYILSVTATQLVLATTEGSVNTRKRFFHK